MAGLAEAAGARVVGRLVQRREAPDATTYLGKGKVQELKSLAAQTKADAVVFDNDLSPGQVRNLEKAVAVKVLDRSELILDIFATRAQTHEARLAVELAQLEYSMPRLKRMWTHLSRLTAGMGVRGPGEKQLEVDRRLVERRIDDLRAELRQIERRKEREVAARTDLMTVSLVGYTNAGKTSLMNALTDAGRAHPRRPVRHARHAHAALAPARLGAGAAERYGRVHSRPAAPFGRQLQGDAGRGAAGGPAAARGRCRHPDGPGPDRRGVRSAPGDRHPGEGYDPGAEQDRRGRRPGRVDGLLGRYPHAVPISARTGEGLAQLASAVGDALSRGFLDLDVNLAVADGRHMAYLAAHGEVLSKRYQDGRVVVHCRIPRRFSGELEQEGIALEPHSNGQPPPLEPRRGALR